MKKRRGIPLVQRVDHILGACRGKSVLHLGCTDWPFTVRRMEEGSLLHVVLGKVAAELWGFDFDEAGISLLRERGVKNLFRADLEDLDAVPVQRTFDVVLAGEMIEHLANPGRFLRGVRRFLRPGGVLLITTINAYCGFRFLIYALRGRGGSFEPVHPDHVTYYSGSTLRKLLAGQGYDVRDFLFYDIGTEHRPHLPFYWRWANDACVRLLPHLADGIIAECVPAGPPP